MVKFPSIFINHGGGPLPLLGRQPELVQNMKDIVTNHLKPLKEEEQYRGASRFCLKQNVTYFRTDLGHFPGKGFGFNKKPKDVRHFCIVFQNSWP